MLTDDPDQLYLADDMAPPPDPDVPEIRFAIDHALEAKEQKARAAEAFKTADDTVLRLLKEHGLEKHPYRDPKTGNKRWWVADTTPKSKSVKAFEPKKKGKLGREKKPKTPMSEQVESRRVPRATVEAEIDPFGAVRSVLDDARNGTTADVSGPPIASNQAIVFANPDRVPRKGGRASNPAKKGKRK